MRFMIMVFGDEAGLRRRTPDRIEHEVAFLAELEDELAQRGEIVTTEVLEWGSAATLVRPGGDRHRGNFNAVDTPLVRFWVVKVPDESRALEIAARVAHVLREPVEVRQCMEASHTP